MTLTTQTSASITESPVTDVNANVPSPNTPRPRALSPEARILMDSSIVARPLLTPEVASIKVKNTAYYYRWVPRPIGEGGPRNGGELMYTQRLAMGFTNATADDVEVLVGDTLTSSGEVRCGEMILMKLPFERWAGHVKANMLRAQTLARMRGVSMDGASTDVFDNSTPRRESVANDPFMRAKAQPFIPADPDKIIDGQTASAQARARATVAEIRNKQSKDKE